MADINWALARKKEILTERARIIQAIRVFFIERNFLEIETPHRIRVNAPELHIDAVPSAGGWLQTSPELAMKRLIAAGFGNIFQVCRVWRGNEKGTRHLPEFTMLEWYRPGADYHQLMDDCQDLLRHLLPDGRFTYRGTTIDLQEPWTKLTVKDAFVKYAKISTEEAIARNCFEEILVRDIEPALGMDPVFLTEYPSPLAALARTKPADPTVAERCELYLGGLELANGFSELTDPVEQRRRFEREEAERRAAGKTPCPLPEEFLGEISQMPETAGIAFGIDRLIMLLTDAKSLDEVVAFPEG